MKKTRELVTITKTYDLILRSCNHTSRLPQLTEGSRGIERRDFGRVPSPRE